MEKCPHCGLIHGPRCPSVKAIEYFPDGTVKRVEYLTPADYASPLPPIFPDQPPTWSPSPIPYCSADPPPGRPTMLPDGTWILRP